MEKSKVYFTNLRTTFDCNLLQKLKKLITAAGIGNIDFTNKYAAIKSTLASRGTWPSCGPTTPRWWPTP